MVLLQRQKSCPKSCSKSSQLPMGNDEFETSIMQQYTTSTYSEVRKDPSSFSEITDSIITKWFLPLTYGLVVLSWFSAFRFNDSLSQISSALDTQHKDLMMKQKDTRRLLSQAKAMKTKVLKEYKHLKATRHLFEHELRMMEELSELYRYNQSKENRRMLEKRTTGIAMTWVRKRQEALISKIHHLQEYVQTQSRQRVVKKFGPGPHRIRFRVKPNGKRAGDFIVELAPLDTMPHAVETFLEMVTNRLWDNTVFYHHKTQHHVLAAAPVNYGTFDTKHYHFDALGYTGVSFPEYSAKYPHKQYTIGFSGTGPNFYINSLDNTKHHGPGGQGHHILPGDADPCFGQIVSGQAIIKDMMPGTHSSSDKPVSWQDFDLTQIVKIELIQY